MPIKPITIRLSESQRQTESRPTLDGVPYRFRFRYARETDRWTLSIFDSAGTLIAAGIRIVLGVDLLGQLHHLAVPPGQLFAYDTARPTSPTDPVFVEPGRDDVDARVLLLYRPAAEVVT